MVIVYFDAGHGWAPITYMAHLCAELFEAELIVLRHESKPSTIDKILALFPRVRGQETCLAIAGDPLQLRWLLQLRQWRRHFKHIGAWIIDSPRADAIPRVVRYGKIFDQFFVTTDEDVQIWRNITGRPTTCVPWGSDVLRLGSSNSIRYYDLMRVGRQPPEWDDDQKTSQTAEHYNLRFHGRPAILANPMANQRTLMQLYANTKFVLAFSNTVDRTTYTHPNRSYITARWTDALAAGATVVGILPDCQTARRLLWAGATIDLGSTDRQENFGKLSRAAAVWTPHRAAQNHLLAAKHLDWRWRFNVIASALQQTPMRLASELDQLRALFLRNNDQ